MDTTGTSAQIIANGDAHLVKTGLKIRLVRVGYVTVIILGFFRDAEVVTKRS